MRKSPAPLKPYFIPGVTAKNITNNKNDTDSNNHSKFTLEKINIPVDYIHGVYELYRIPNFLTDIECQEYKKFIISQKCDQKILPNKEISTKIWSKLSKYVSDTPYIMMNGTKFMPKQLSSYVTISAHTYPKVLDLHYDAKYDYMPNNMKAESFENLGSKPLYNEGKLIIYLDDIKEKGGTCFYAAGNKLIYTAKPVKGTAYIFGIGQLHSGEQLLQGDNKYLIGFRLLGTRDA